MSLPRLLGPGRLPGFAHAGTVVGAKRSTCPGNRRRAGLFIRFFLYSYCLQRAANYLQSTVGKFAIGLFEIRGQRSGGGLTGLGNAGSLASRGLEFSTFPGVMKAVGIKLAPWAA